MAKIVRGRRTADGVTVLRGGQQGLRKIRCQSCHGFAVETRQGNGKMLYVCSCGASYKTTKM